MGALRTVVRIEGVHPVPQPDAGPPEPLPLPAPEPRPRRRRLVAWFVAGAALILVDLSCCGLMTYSLLKTASSVPTPPSSAPRVTFGQRLQAEYPRLAPREELTFASGDAVVARMEYRRRPAFSLAIKGTRGSESYGYYSAVDTSAPSLVSGDQDRADGIARAWVESRPGTLVYSVARRRTPEGADEVWDVRYVGSLSQATLPGPPVGSDVLVFETRPRRWHFAEPGEADRLTSAWSEAEVRAAAARAFPGYRVTRVATYAQDGSASEPPCVVLSNPAAPGFLWAADPLGDRSAAGALTDEMTPRFLMNRDPAFAGFQRLWAHKYPGTVVWRFAEAGSGGSGTWYVYYFAKGQRFSTRQPLHYRTVTYTSPPGSDAGWHL